MKFYIVYIGIRHMALYEIFYLICRYTSHGYYLSYYIVYVGIRHMAIM